MSLTDRSNVYCAVFLVMCVCSVFFSVLLFCVSCYVFPALCLLLCVVKMKVEMERRAIVGYNEETRSSAEEISDFDKKM